MPRPMLRTPQNQTQSQTVNNNILSATRNQEHEQQQQQMDKMKLDQLLRKKRSKEYMEALHKLDAVNDIIRTIQEEFPEVQLGGVLLGYVSICYLGKPYEVHTLDLTGGIIEHYKTGETLPDGLEKARTIAMRGGYEFIETAAGRSVPADMFL